MAPLLQVNKLCKFFPVYAKGVMRKQVGTVRAVDHVSFELQKGETLGIVGESGSGKTTCARAILRAFAPTSGEVLFRRENGETPDLTKLTPQELKPLRQEMQMIFQDPFASLNPRMTVGDIVAEPLAIHGIGDKKERTDRVVEMLEKVGLSGELRERYPHAFSGGQRQRIGIARALIMRPSLVVADEAVSALDVSVQAQVINLLQDLQEEFGLSYLFVAHDLAVVRHICDRVAVMYAGRVVELAETEALFNDPQHPYTQGLLKSIPEPDPSRRMDFALAGEVADPSNLPPGCAFHPRCPHCFEPCDQKIPALAETHEGHRAACFLHHAESLEASEAKAPA